MKSGLFSYLSFNGNCREAMLFYQQCIGGQLFFQTIGESPLSGKIPKKMKDCILHGRLTKGGMVLLGTDMTDEPLVKGNAVSLMLTCISEKQLRAYYHKLAEGGETAHPPATTQAGGLMGGLRDKFGNHWLLHFAGKAGKN